eukprot:TRINITY_DN1008_c0_g2_i2.p3 TRINITY_DN1008_c0_g2~~TRINITY_DN1008_c0_g2_i2.p3  ORF type:complete len:297 (-),score=41.67 TRINITY_DN1008_c0_g2_i2:135-911(-)
MDAEGFRKIEQNGNGNGRVLGKDPKTNLEVVVKQGPYGWYVQLGEKQDYPDGTPPKRVSLGKKINDFDKLTLDSAMQLLKYPLQLGTHQEMEVYLKKGPFGFYVQIGESQATIPKSINLDDVAMPNAIQLLEQKVKKLGINLGDATSKKKLNAKKKNTTTKTQEDKVNKNPKKASANQKNTKAKTKKTSVGNEKKQKGTKEAGNKLVRKKSNWMVFLSRHSNEVAEKENLKPSQVMKLLGERWRGMSQEEKSQYQDKV